MNKMKKCILCGKEYEYCGKCSGKNKPKWMNLYDNENCKKIFDLASDYYAGDNIKELKAQYEECDFKDLATYPEDIQKAVKAVKSQISKTTKKIEISE